jgi:uncharacterized surface protein with fasciclin (FAS1) repeats
MKKLVINVAIFVIGSLLSLNSCKKTEMSATASTPLSTIQTDPDLTIFSTVERTAGDDSLINKAGAIIVPVDSAFVNAGLSAAIVGTLSQAVCDSIVRYFTIPNGISLGGTANVQMPFVTNLTVPVYADSATSGLYFNGAAAISPVPITSVTSSIYKLSHFVNLPAASVAQAAAADNTLSFFNEAFIRTNLAASLTSGSYTLFIPNNAAFINAGYPDIPSIDAADLTTLTHILQYHVVANSYFLNDLALQTSLTSLQGEAVQVTNSSGTLQFTGTSDPSSPAGLLSSGMLAGNVLVYKISNVLLP